MSTSMTSNRFTSGSIGRVFAMTAIPIVVVMATNGLLTVTDAIFLGLYVGPEALGAVTVIFPLVMLLMALGTMVSSGMASILARRLGAGDLEGARAIFAGAHGLGLLICGVAIVLFLLLGQGMVVLAANGRADLAEMAHVYLLITVVCAPVAMLLGLNSDALRVEGRIGLMAGLSLGVSLGNIGLNFVFIGLLGLGVAGSALGTVVAQAVALTVVLGLRLRDKGPLGLRQFAFGQLGFGWARCLSLGAPQSLAFVGLSLITGLVIVMIQTHGAGAYDATVAAYGAVNRILSLSFLVLMGLGQALQAIVGNNIGAGRPDRSDAALRLALIVAFVFGLAVQLAAWIFRDQWGALFTDDPEVVAIVARILPLMTAAYCPTGPQVMLVNYFQAIGDARRTAVLGLGRTYLLVLPSTALLPMVLGETGIWIASPVAEILLLGLLALVLAQSARSQNRRLGLFMG